jgi:FixJ family two-component response regulator
VAAFASAKEFLAAYDPNQPGCLVLDVALPGMSGLELQRKLVQERIDLPVVFITGHGSVQMAVGAMQAGAVNFLEKPFHEQDLWDSVSTVEDRRARLMRKMQAKSIAELVQLATAR